MQRDHVLGGTKKAARLPEPPFNLSYRTVPVASATARPSGCAHIPRAITIFMTSFEPPKIRVMRLSRYMRAIG